MNKEELQERLYRLDEDAQLTFSEETEFKCYIVGGGAFILMGYAIRATHDLDVLETMPKNIETLLGKYDMNTSVKSYYDNFPQDFESRAIPVNINTTKIKFYTLSLEDLVISKLCTTRGQQDITDINNDLVINSINWDILDKLALNIETTMMSSISRENFRYYYNDYVRRNKS